MREKIDNKYIYWGLTAFSVLAALVLLFFGIYRWNYVSAFLTTLIDILMPFIVGLVIAYMLNPLVIFFENKLFKKIVKKKKNMVRVFSITLASLIFLGIIIAFFSLLIPNIIKSIETLATNIDIYLNDSKNVILSWFENERVKSVIVSIYASMSSSIEGWFTTDNLENIFLIVRDSVFSTLKIIYNVVIGFIVAIYVLYDKETFKGQIKKFLYSVFSEEKVKNILDNFKNTDRVFADFFNAKLLDSLIVGIICFIGMLIFKMPYATMISVIVGVTNIIPYFGPYIGALPSALIILLVDPSKCLPFLVFIFLLQQFDGSILGPKILGSKTGLSSFWVLFSLLIFGRLFGVIGMIIGVPIFSIFYSYINNQLKKRLKEKKLPLDSPDYIDEFKPKKRRKVTV